SMAMKHRLQFDFTDESLRELDELRKETGLASRADLIRQALRFFTWLFMEVRGNNSRLLIEREGQLREVVFPFWVANSTVIAGNGDRTANQRSVASEN